MPVFPGTRGIQRGHEQAGSYCLVSCPSTAVQKTEQDKHIHLKQANFFVPGEDQCTFKDLAQLSENNGQSSICLFVWVFFSPNILSPFLTML